MRAWVGYQIRVVGCRFLGHDDHVLPPVIENRMAFFDAWCRRCGVDRAYQLPATLRLLRSDEETA